MSGESIGYGSKFFLADSAGVLQKGPRVVSIGTPKAEWGEVEVTNFESAGRFREFIKTLRDAGSFSVTFNYVAGDAWDVLCRAADNSADNFAAAIILSDAAGDDAVQIDVNGFVQMWSVDDLDKEGVKTATLNYRVSGAIAENAPTAGA